MPGLECIRRRSLRRAWIGVGALLFGCGTEHVELGPGQSSVSTDPTEDATTPSDPVSPLPAPPVATLDVQSVSPTESSEGAARKLGLIGGPSPDTGHVDVPPPALAVPAEGCTKVDFLFVVDNSASMRDRQTALVQSFPGFIQVVSDTLGLSDFHILVVSTDGRSPSELLRESPPIDSALCEKMRGAGKRLSESGASCNFATEQRFIVQNQPGLEQAFACVAQVGTQGSALEHPVDAMLDALSPTLNGAGGCNAGFLRDDALLFITLITDEDDDLSAGDPPDWQSQVLSLKGGDPKAVVALGIVADGNLSTPVCKEFQRAPRLQAFLQGFGLIGSVCAADYSSTFQQAADSLAARCADFVPTPQ